jgi:predicted nucleotidyltransferase
MQETVDPQTQRAAKAFLERISTRYDVSKVLLFGSRAADTHRPDSDADLAIVIRGERLRRSEIALDMAGTAFEILLDTGTLIEALPLWESEFEDPEQFANPALIRAIRRDGIQL